MSACERPARAKVSHVVVVMRDQDGNPREFDQGRQVTFFYANGSASYLAPMTGMANIPHACLN